MCLEGNMEQISMHLSYALAWLNWFVHVNAFDNVFSVVKQSQNAETQSKNHPFSQVYKTVRNLVKMMKKLSLLCLKWGFHEFQRNCLSFIHNWFNLGNRLHIRLSIRVSTASSQTIKATCIRVSYQFHQGQSPLEQLGVCHGQGHNGGGRDWNPQFSRQLTC